MSQFDEVRVLWRTIAELQLQIQHADTGHIRTTINTLLDHVRAKERRLCDQDLTALALIQPDRWQRDWCAVI